MEHVKSGYQCWCVLTFAQFLRHLMPVRLYDLYSHVIFEVLQDEGNCLLYDRRKRETPEESVTSAAVDQMKAAVTSGDRIAHLWRFGGQSTLQ